jgi:hypothetical protein
VFPASGFPLPSFSWTDFCFQRNCKKGGGGDKNDCDHKKLKGFCRKPIEVPSEHDSLANRTVNPPPAERCMKYHRSIQKNIWAK